MQNSDNAIFGPVKIKDGLFIGDEIAAQDLEFLVTNKVSHIINCAGKQIMNGWESIGVSYLTLNWIESDNQVLFDPKDEIINELYKFIENALNKGESVLVHSVRGQNRCTCVLAVYFMKKYKWTLYKSLEFLNAKKPNLEVRPSFLNQLLAVEAKFSKLGIGAKNSTWNDFTEDPANLDSEELLLTNTFLNAKKVNIPESINSPKKEKRNRLDWADFKLVGGESKAKLVTIINKTELASKKDTSDGFKLRKRSLSVKSILKKGSQKIFSFGETEEEKSAGEDLSTIKQGPTSNTLRESSSAPLNRPSTKQIPKSNSTAGFEKSDEKQGQQMQGANVIHITVNNFITNNTITTMKQEDDIPRAKLGSQSLGDLASGPSVILKSSKKGNDGTSRTGRILIKKNFSATFGRENEQPVSRPKLNNFLGGASGPVIGTDESVGTLGMAIYGSQPFKTTQSKSLGLTKESTPSNQQLIANGLSLNKTQPANDMYGNFGPLKSATNKSAMEYTPYKTADFRNNPINPLQKIMVKRPPTAPENSESTLKRFMMNSPYYSNMAQEKDKIKKPATGVPGSREGRESSTQPQDGGNKFIISQVKLRNPSPGQFSSFKFMNDIQISNKPRWKF